MHALRWAHSTPARLAAACVLFALVGGQSTPAAAYKYLSCNNMCCECVSTSRTAKADYVRLKNDIFDGYEKHVRPVFDYRTAIPIKVQVRLKAIVDVKEAEQTIIISQSFGLYWVDELLAWDKHKYNGIDNMLVAASELWFPDIILYESLGAASPLKDDVQYVTVWSDGKTKVTWPELTHFHCDFEVVEFPFDVQECLMTYASWRYSTNEVVAWPVGSGEELIAAFKENGEFELMEFSVDYKNRTGSSGTSAFSEIYFKMKIRRRPEYYLITLIVPVFAITNLAIIGIFSPSSVSQERGEKVSMGLTALLTTSVMLLMVSDMMPKSLKGLPRLGSYILWEMTITTVCTVIAVACMYVHSEASFGEPVPRWLLRATGLSHKAADGSGRKLDEHDPFAAHADPFTAGDPSSRVASRPVHLAGMGDSDELDDVKSSGDELAAGTPADDGQPPPPPPVTTFGSASRRRLREFEQRQRAAAANVRLVNVRPLLDNGGADDRPEHRRQTHSLSTSSLAARPNRSPKPVDVPNVDGRRFDGAEARRPAASPEKAHLAAVRAVVDHVHRMRRCFDEKQGDDELITLWNLVCYRIDNMMLVLFLTMSFLVTFYYTAI